MTLPICVPVLSPAVLVLSVAIQLYVAAAPLVNVRFTLFPLQTVLVLALVITGLGFTVIVSVKFAPVQLPNSVGVTV